MRLLMRRLLVSAAILMVCLPASFFVGILSYPFWAWVEERFGVEAVGRSGPAGWCYVAVFLALSMPSLLAYWLASRPGRRRI